MLLIVEKSTVVSDRMFSSIYNNIYSTACMECMLFRIVFCFLGAFTMFTRVKYDVTECIRGEMLQLSPRVDLWNTLYISH